MGVTDEAYRLDLTAHGAVEKLVLGSVLDGRGAHSRATGAGGASAS